MYQANGSTIKYNFLRDNRQMYRTEGIFPTRTMRLHQRLVGWHRKRRIPVRYADTPSTLSAYLIDPKYLENGEVILPTDKKATETVPVKKPSHVPVYQYSKITHDETLGHSKISTELTHSTKHIRKKLGLWFSALGSELQARYRALAKPSPQIQYAVDRGVLPWWRRRVTMFAIVSIVSATFVGLALINPEDKGLTQPTTGNTSHVQNTSSSRGASSAQSSDTTHASSVNQPQYQQQLSPATSSPQRASQTTGANQQTTGLANNLVPAAGTSVGSSSTPATTSPTTTTTQPSVPTTPPTTPTQTIDPLTSSVNGLLSTQVNVTVPVTGNSEPVIQTPNLTVGL